MKPYYDQDGVTIYHGDCRDVLSQLPAASVTLSWTDPPYGNRNHEGDWNSRLNAHRGIEDVPIANDSPEEMRQVVDAALTLSMRLLVRDCCSCICTSGGGGSRETRGDYGPPFAWAANRMDEKGLAFFHSVIWDKLKPGLGWRFRRQHEMIMVAHREGARLAWADDNVAVPNIIRLAPPRDRRHPNEKPFGLPALFISLTTKPGDLVLDPFAGSFTTLHAAKELGRRAIGIELDERYCEAAAERLSQRVLDLCAPAVVTGPVATTETTTSTGGDGPQSSAGDDASGGPGGDPGHLFGDVPLVLPMSPDMAAALQASDAVLELQTSPLLVAGSFATEDAAYQALDSRAHMGDGDGALREIARPCAAGHEWSNNYGDDWKPEPGTPCDCGARRWGQQPTYHPPGSKPTEDGPAPVQQQMGLF
jgi:site-specific DNA-methyltransferase (adenine-specific)